MAIFSLLRAMYHFRSERERERDEIDRERAGLGATEKPNQQQAAGTKFHEASQSSIWPAEADSITGYERSRCSWIASLLEGFEGARVREQKATQITSSSSSLEKRHELGLGLGLELELKLQRLLLQIEDREWSNVVYFPTNFSNRFSHDFCREQLLLAFCSSNNFSVQFSFQLPASSWPEEMKE